jgi:hypothetical protein
MEADNLASSLAADWRPDEEYEMPAEHEVEFPHYFQHREDEVFVKAGDIDPKSYSGYSLVPDQPSPGILGHVEMCHDQDFLALEVVGEVEVVVDALLEAKLTSMNLISLHFHLPTLDYFWNCLEPLA